MRIKHKVRVQIADDANMKNLLFSKDDDLSEKTVDGYVRQVSGKFTVPMNTNEDLSLGDITAVKGLYIEADQDIQIKLNGSSDAIQLRKAPDTSSTTQFFIEADISQVNVIAPVTVDANGTYCFWGDVS